MGEQMDTGDAMLLDAVGATVIRTFPAGQIAISLDMEGRLNRLQIRDAHRYLLTAEHAAELIAALLVAGEHASAESAAQGVPVRSFVDAMLTAVNVEVDRLLESEGLS